MASSLGKGNGHSKFINKSPHFFKIIFQENLRHSKLGIPPRFIEKYGNSMSSPALLRVPSGEVWKVELRKSDGIVWLKNGWQEFANHYSLKHGHFLVFRYEGNGNFHVIMFGRTATEIDYPYTSKYHGQFKEISEESDSEDDECIEILDDVRPAPSRKFKEKPELPCPQPHKKMRSTNSANITESNLKSECMAPQAMHNGCPAKEGDKSTRNCHRIQALKADKKALALRRAARAFKSENPFFVLAMQPSYVRLHKKRALALPNNFVRKHLMQAANGEIILCNSNGKTWPVNFHLRGQGTDLRATLNAGWLIFAQDNDIQVGDVCAFELINCVEISFKVVRYQGEDRTCHESSTFTHVLRPVKGNAGASSSSQGRWKRCNALQRAKVSQLANALRSENPSFTIVLRPSYVHSNRMTVPKNFAKRYFRKKPPKVHHELVLRLSNGKSWPVTFYQWSIEVPNAKICTGWRTFVVDNNLEVGDVCVFELNLSDTETSFKVTIQRKQSIEDANLRSSCAGSRGNRVKIESKESLDINAESDPVHSRGHTSGLQNQHLNEEFPMPKVEENNVDDAGEALDDFWLSERIQLTEKSESRSKAEEEEGAGQKFQNSLDKEATQDSKKQD